MIPFAVRVRVVAVPMHAIAFGADRTMGFGRLCPYCTKTMDVNRRPTIDHVVPRSKGGTNDPGNLMIVCRDCNNDKANFGLFEFAGYLDELGDDRSKCVIRLCESVMDGWDSDLIASAYAEMAFGRLRAMRPRIFGLKPPIKPLPAIAPAVAKNNVIRMADHAKTRERIHNVLYAAGIPLTHWTLVKPNKVRVLIGSLSEVFEFQNEERLMSEIIGHPRYAFVKNGTGGRP